MTVKVYGVICMPRSVDHETEILFNIRHIALWRERDGCALGIETGSREKERKMIRTKGGARKRDDLGRTKIALRPGAAR
jgi:hypothetical protein